MNNNIKLEIEMTNRERGDSVISDIEAALDVPMKKNKTLNKTEIEEIQKNGIIIKCNEIHDKYQILIYILKGGGLIMCCFGLVYIIVYGFTEFIKYIFNYI